jgi:hypothetical protein
VLTVSDVTASGVTVTWTGTGATGYTVGRDGTDSQGTGPWSQTVGPTVRSQSFTHLRPGTAYALFVQPTAGTRATVSVTTSGGSTTPTVTSTSTVTTPVTTPVTTTPVTTTPVTTTPVPGTPMPVGVPGAWVPRFTDEFSGNAIDTALWNTNEGKNQNGVTNHAANVTVSGGSAVMTLTSSSSGAMLSSGVVDNVGVNHFLLPIGGYAEARILFPGSGTTINNWPAWWLVGNGWPANGENDIAEGLGQMTVNYHSSGLNTGSTVAGTWSGAYHVYGVQRLATSTQAYYDGVLVKTWATADPGIGQALVLNLGNGFGPAVYGAASQLRVDYVRAWTR